MTYFAPMPPSSLNMQKVNDYVQRHADTFYRAITFTGGTVTVAGNGDLIIGDATSTESQFKVHNIQSHIGLFETDGANYPDTYINIDINSEVFRLQWEQAPSTFFPKLHLYGPDHSTNAHDIDLLNSAGGVVMRWDDSAAAFVYGQNVPVQFEDGSAAAPSISFNTAGRTDDGFYSAAESQIGVAAAGANVATFASTAGHNLQGLAWTTYTPTVTADGGSPTAGNATLAGRYVRIGNLVHVAVNMTLGNTTNFGTGSVYMSLPVAALDNSPWNDQLIGMGIGVETGAVTVASCHVQRDLNADRVKFLSINDAAATPANFSGGSAIPFTWGTGDILRWTATYEAA